MAALTATRTFDGGHRLWRVGLVLLIAGAAGCVLGALSDARQALFSYLTAFFFVVTIQVGALFFMLIAQLSAARWSLPFRRLNEAAAASLVVAPLLFLPIVAGASHLYTWVEEHAPQRVVDFLPGKGLYLNVPAFTARAAIYFVVWLGVALLLRRSSLARERGVAADRPWPPSTVCAAGLPLIALTFTFAAVDWVMSLEHEWFSSMFGIYCFAGGYVAAIALLTIAAYGAERSGWLAGLLNPWHYHALGRMLLAFTIFWAYIAYFQFFLIYIADRPEEAAYFVRRNAGSWRGFALAFVVFHFALPFLLLLLRGLKLRPGALSALAAWMLFVHYMDVYFLVMPVLHGDGFRPHWLDLAALAAASGAAIVASLWLLRGHPIAPHADPEFAIGVEYRSS